VAALDQAIDDLYKLPLAEFTATRNALAKTVRGADASRVRKQGKPTAVAWAVNQVYWRVRPVFDRVLKTGERLREAQIAALTGKAADLRDANEAHRRAVGEAVKAAEHFALEAGSHPAPDALMRTFETLSLAKELPAPPGRLTDALQPAGFEALAGVSPIAPNRPAPERPRADGTKGAEDEKKRAADEKKRAADERKRAAAVKRAEAAVERAKAKMREAEAALRRTQGRS
jgi:hypothetical protein